MAQNFGFTVVLVKQAHSRLRNCFTSAAVGTKDKSDSGIIEFSFLSHVTDLNSWIISDTESSTVVADIFDKP